MNDAMTQILAVGETLSLFEEALFEEALIEEALIEEALIEKALLQKDFGNKPFSQESVTRSAGVMASSGPIADDAKACNAKAVSAKEGGANSLNVHQSELPLGLQDINEFASKADSEVRQLEIVIATPNLLLPEHTLHQVTENHLAGQIVTPGGDDASLARGQSDLPLVLVESVDRKSHSMMTAGSINRTKPSPTPDIESSTRHFEAAMTLAQQMRSKRKPSRNELCSNSTVLQTLIAPSSVGAEGLGKECLEKGRLEKKYSEKSVTTRNGKTQTLNLRQRCLEDLEESRKFVKRSKESLVGIAKPSQSIVAGKKNQRQIGYQRSLIGYSASMNAAQVANLCASRSILEKKIHVNVKKQEQQMRKQAGILICRHLVAALRIQAAHEGNTIS